ncbi:MAG: tetratricopeptide repeat protein [Polyangiales bacterium]
MRVLAALAVSLLSIPAHAQGVSVPPIAVTPPPAPATTAAPATAPEAPAGRTASPAAIAIQEGLEALRTGRSADALPAFVRARESEPSRPEAHYYLGVALRREGRLDDALVTFRTALSVATTANDAALRLRARIAVADTLERMPGRLAEARAAWDELRQAAAQGDATIPSDLPRLRVEAIDARLRLDEEATVVRRRIEERAQAAAHGAHHGHGATHGSSHGATHGTGGHTTH